MTLFPVPSWIPSWLRSSATSRGMIWLAVLALGGAVSTAAARQFHPALEVEVATAPASVGAIVRRVLATGTLQPVTTVQVGAQVSGTIKTLEVDFNAVVHRGQVLARLDPALFEGALSEAQGAVQQSQAALVQAQADQRGSATAAEDAGIKLRRAEELAAKQLIPQSDLDAARIAMDEASADLRSAESRIGQANALVDEATAALEQAQVNLDHTVITSPIDGIVVSRNVDVGQTVAAAFQTPVLFSIASDLRRLQLQMHIDMSDIGGVHAGEPATFEVEAYPDETFIGTVSQVRLQPIAEQTATATTVGAAAATTDIPTVLSYPTIVDVANADERLRPGMTATVTVDGSRRDHTLRVPNTALSFRPPPPVLAALAEPAGGPLSELGGRQVWKYDHRHFTAVNVRTGLSDGQWTEVTDSALHDGEPLVTNAWLAAVGR